MEISSPVGCQGRFTILRAGIVAGLIVALSAFVPLVAVYYFSSEPLGELLYPDQDGILKRTLLHIKTAGRLKRNPHLVFSRDDEGRTPLYWATFHSWKDVAQLLLQYGADADAKDFHHGETPLHLAVNGNDEDMMRLLLDHGADINATVGTFGATPLQLAASNGRTETVGLLLARGARINAGALNVATRYGHRDVVKQLLANHADVGEGYGGLTPLYLAAQEGYSDVAELLLAHGARVGDRLRGFPPPELADWYFGNENKEGWTPLHAAVAGGHKDVVQALLAHKADINARDAHGRTPLRVAGTDDLRTWLSQHGGHE
jgi:ankyrin repeat protein